MVTKQQQKKLRAALVANTPQYDNQTQPEESPPVPCSPRLRPKKSGSLTTPQNTHDSAQTAASARAPKRKRPLGDMEQPLQSSGGSPTDFGTNQIHTSVVICSICSQLDGAKNFNVSPTGKVIGKGTGAAPPSKFVFLSGLCVKHQHMWKEAPSPVGPIASRIERQAPSRAQGSSNVWGDLPTTETARLMLELEAAGYGSSRGERPFIKSKL